MRHDVRLHSTPHLDDAADAQDVEPVPGVVEVHIVLMLLVIVLLGYDLWRRRRR